MKRICLKLVMALALVAVSSPAWAQDEPWRNDPKYGADPAQREENVLMLNFFNDAYNNKDYPTAIGYMQQLMERAPRSSENIYISGANIYKNKIARAKSVAEKNNMIDSLFIIYDKRIESFGDHPTRGRAYLLSLKARDFLTYKPKETATVSKLFNEAIEAGGDNVDLDIVNIYYQSVVDSFKKDETETDVVLNEYDRLGGIVDRSPSDKKEEARKTLDALFVSSGAANCENIEKVYREKLAANPDDESNIERAFASMTRAKCTGEFYLQTAEKYYSIKPTSEVAMTLAGLFESNKEYTRAMKYLNEALPSEQDPMVKSNLYVRIAANNLGAKNARGAADAARQALSLNPENGYAQLTLAQAYGAAVSANCSGFDRQAGFWLVYDMFAQARNMLSDEPEIARSAEQQMGSYRAGFPSREECFFRGLNAGDSYTVNCGFASGRTSVRPNN